MSPLLILTVIYILLLLLLIRDGLLCIHSFFHSSFLFLKFSVIVIFIFLINSIIGESNKKRKSN
jgi:hypothetical protein